MPEHRNGSAKALEQLRREPYTWIEQMAKEDPVADELLTKMLESGVAHDDTQALPRFVKLVLSIYPQQDLTEEDAKQARNSAKSLSPWNGCHTVAMLLCKEDLRRRNKQDLSPEDSDKYAAKLRKIGEDAEALDVYNTPIPQLLESSKRASSAHKAKLVRLLQATWKNMEPPQGRGSREDSPVENDGNENTARLAELFDKLTEAEAKGDGVGVYAILAGYVERAESRSVRKQKNNASAVNGANAVEGKEMQTGASERLMKAGELAAKGEFVLGDAEKAEAEILAAISMITVIEDARVATEMVNGTDQ